MDKQAIARKIKTLIHEGYSNKKARAIALKYATKAAQIYFLNPRKRNPLTGALEEKVEKHLKQKLRGFIHLTTEEAVSSIYFAGQNKIRISFALHNPKRASVNVESKGLKFFVEDAIEYLETHIGGVWKLNYRISAEKLVLDFVTRALEFKEKKTNPSYTFHKVNDFIVKEWDKNPEWNFVELISHLLLTMDKGSKDYEYVEALFDLIHDFKVKK